jgi:hypothetical protein
MHAYFHVRFCAFRESVSDAEETQLFRICHVGRWSIACACLAHVLIDCGHGFCKCALAADVDIDPEYRFLVPDHILILAR